MAAEMDADWAQVTVKFVTGRDAYRQVAGARLSRSLSPPQPP
ncbi:hypothetical protein IC615_12040 [Serratia ureilytica]